MTNPKPLAAALLGTLGIESLTLANLDLGTKIVCQIAVALFTCYYLYKKSKFKKQ
jgi:hypothetical protein